MIRLASQAELVSWDKLIADNPDNGHIYQSFGWGEYKSKSGWQLVRLVFEYNRRCYYFQLLRRKLGWLGSIYYCPKGPGLVANFILQAATQELLVQFTEQLKGFLIGSDPRPILVKIEPEILAGEIDLTDLGYRKSAQDLQFKATILVDLLSSEAALLASFKPKTRYNINLARRKGVKIELAPANEATFDQLYGLMEVTRQRAGGRYLLRKKKDFTSYWRILTQAKHGQLFLARAGAEILAGAFVMIFSQRAYYKDGGSTGLNRQLMAPYLLQLEAMNWARQQAKIYDLVGVSPPSQQGSGHFMESLLQFKAGFNPSVTEFIGCFDLPLGPNYQNYLRLEKYLLSYWARFKRTSFW